MGESATHVALYAADGRDRFLPLLGDMGPEAHDWGRLLTWMGLVDRAERVGGLIYAFGLLLVFAAVLIMAMEALRAWQNPQRTLRRFHHFDPE